MIQRVQSLFLLFAAALVAAFLTIGDVWRTIVATVYPWVGPLTLVLGLIVIAVSLLAVFLYKDRVRQRKVVLAAQTLDLVLVLVLVAVMVIVNLREDLLWEPAAMQTAYITALLPFGAYVFLRLARHGIEKDIALVKSMDRLR
jgi:phosphoglycerol transferase MdoB-like AlkP superfamily enzyme